MATAVGGYPPPTLAERPPRHPLLEKGTFEQLHRNEVVETRPHVLHFGGFQIHKEHTHILKVLNISPASLRFSIIAPTTKYFSISYDKKGLLAPGMSEDITVYFTPHEWRYYYDTVKIFCGEQGENLVVPLHAYPSANEISLPKIVDFGKVAIGTSKTKRIPLSCKIPIKFEYEITVLQGHPDFEITPLLGVIPPHEATEVIVTFAPTRHRTAHAELEFNIAQFDFDPVTVSLVGSCAPDLVRDDIVNMAQSEQEQAKAQSRKEKMTATASKLKEKKSRPAFEVKHPVHATAPAEKYVDGVKVPTGHGGTQATSFVLSQTAGKMPLKDLNSFIKVQREGLKTLQQEQARKRKEGGSGGGLEEASLAFEEEDKQALELRFEMHYREVEKYDRGKELKSTAAIGEEQPTEEELRHVQDSRRGRHYRILAARMKEDASRVESVLTQGKVTVPQSFRPCNKPSWDEAQNDLSSVKFQVLDRFSRAISKVLMQYRARTRASMLREAIRAAGVYDRDTCRAWVDQETKAAAAGSGESGKPKAKAGGVGQQKRPTTAGSTALGALADEDEIVDVLTLVNIPTDFVLPMTFPTSQAGLIAEERKPMEVQPLGNFEEFKPVKINERLEYKVLDYKQHQVPPAAAYLQPHCDEARLKGALEEHSVRGPRGNAADGAEEPLEMPVSCLFAPGHDAMSLLVPSTECRTYIALPHATECDPEYQLEQTPPLLGPLDTEWLISESIMSIDSPWLSTWRPTRQIDDPFQFLDPIPACFAEAGGSFGSRLGCDVGGERIPFLPVGGFRRDLPSPPEPKAAGADGAEGEVAEEAKPEPPSSESYLEVVRSLATPLSTERWVKEQLREDHLRQTRAADSQAVRKKLAKLNEDLHHRNKVYLG